MRDFEELFYPCFLVFYGPSNTDITKHNRKTYGELVEFHEAYVPAEGKDLFDKFMKAYEGNEEDVQVVSYNMTIRYDI